MIERNKDQIAWEAVHTMNDTARFQDHTYPEGQSQQDCVDDVNDYLV